jgi:cytochrome c5
VSAEDDQVFIKRFTLILVGLVVFTIAIIVLAVTIDGRLERDDSNTAREEARLQRLQPVAGVYSGETGRAAATAAVESAAAAAPQVAFGGSTDGGMIYEQACASCHQAGAAGAPRLIASAWEGRLDKGREQLVYNAINGIGVMPARGGRSDLSDEQIEASVDYMLAELD